LGKECYSTIGPDCGIIFLIIVYLSIFRPKEGKKGALGLKKRKILYIAFMLLVILVGLKQAKDIYVEYKTYSATEILGIENKDFNSEKVIF
jgi:hypothetical protein